MYLLTVVMGLVVYGSDFDSVTGWLYVFPLLLITVFHKWVWSLRFRLKTANSIRIIGTAGALAALFAYAPLHMGYWDEHAIAQALWMAVLGMCSYFISVMAAAEISERRLSYRYYAPGALALIGLFWLFAVYYPMIGLFFLGLMFIFSIVWLSSSQNEYQETIPDSAKTDVIAKYTIFVLAIDIGCIIWDYQVNTLWAFYIAAVFIAGGIGFFIRLAYNSTPLEQTIYVAAIINFSLAVVWPPYLLWGLHTVVAGWCMGYLLPSTISPSATQENTSLSLGWVVWFFMGLVLSNAWYANLQWAFTRLIVVLPFLILGIIYAAYRFAAARHHA